MSASTAHSASSNASGRGIVRPASSGDGDNEEEEEILTGILTPLPLPPPLPMCAWWYGKCGGAPDSDENEPEDGPPPPVIGSVGGGGARPSCTATRRVTSLGNTLRSAAEEEPEGPASWSSTSAVRKRW